MLLEFLQDALGIDTRVGIVEAHDETERNYVIFSAVNPGAAVFFRGQRPSHGVDDFAGSDAAGRNLPQFLDALSIGLRVAVAIEREARDELLGQRSARAFGKNHNLGLQVIAGFEI